MPKVADEELNGAANALLGLYACDSSRPSPSPAPTAPLPPRRSVPSSQPNPEEQPGSEPSPRWSSALNTASPSFRALEPMPRAQEVPVPAPGAPVAEHQGVPANPYPLYPKPPTAAATTPYVVEHRQHQGYYSNPPSVVSRRRDFLGAPGGRGGGAGGGARGGWAQPSASVVGPATTTPRRRTEWTPRFGRPMAADRRAVMAVQHAPPVDAWTFLQHQRQQHQQPRMRSHRSPSPSPSHYTGPPDASRHMMYQEYPQNLADGVEAHHPAARDPHHHYAHAAARPGAATGHLSQYEYPPQQHTPYRFNKHQQQQPQPEQPHESFEQQPATTPVAVPRPEPLQEQPQPQQQPQPRSPPHQRQQQQQQQPPREDVQQQHPPQEDVQQQQQQHQQQQQQQNNNRQQQQQRQPSINNLWSLIPGARERQGSSRLGDHDATAGGSGAPPHSQQQLSRGTGSCNSKRWFAPDVHLPLSDIARRHRARALARLRARRQALAEAALIPGRLAPVKRHSSETTNEADSGSDEDDDVHRSKVFVVEDKGGLARVVSGGLTRGVSGGVVRAVSMSSAVGAPVADGADKGEGVPPAGGDAKAETAAARAMPVTSGDNPAAAATISSSFSSSQSTAPAPHAANASGGSKPGNGNGTGTGNGSTASKVGDLFELMRNVTMSFGTGGAGDTADGEENLARELGKPVKYRYRQEAARSRKRTRGRFVSEKAPAFVSITELMALRRAEREQQQKQEATRVPVGAG